MNMIAIIEREGDGYTSLRPVPDHAEIRIGTLRSIIFSIRRFRAANSSRHDQRECLCL